MEAQEIVLTGKAEKPEDYICVIDVEYGERHFVRDGAGYKEVTKPSKKPVRTHSDRSYVVSEAESFISYIERYGNPDDGIIFFNDAGLTMFFEENSRVESVRLPLKPSLELRVFLGDNATGKAFWQKDLVKAFEMFPEVADVKTILPYVEKLKLDINTEIESDVDPRNHVFVFKEKQGNQTANIPKQINFRMPYFEGSKVNLDILVDFEIRRPMQPPDKVTFVLGNPKAERTKRDAIKAEIEQIQAALGGWMFVQGEPRI